MSKYIDTEKLFAEIERRYAPDIRPAIESTAYHFWNKAINARKEK